MLFRDFKARGLRSIPIAPIVGLTAFFLQKPIQRLIHFRFHAILVPYGNIDVPVHI